MMVLPLQPQTPQTPQRVPLQTRLKVLLFRLLKSLRMLKDLEQRMQPPPPPPLLLLLLLLLLRQRRRRRRRQLLLRQLEVLRRGAQEMRLGKLLLWRLRGVRPLKGAIRLETVIVQIRDKTARRPQQKGQASRLLQKQIKLLRLRKRRGKGSNQKGLRSPQTFHRR